MMEQDSLSLRLKVFSPDAQSEHLIANLSRDDRRAPVLEVLHVPEPQPRFLTERRVEVLHGSGVEDVTFFQTLNASHRQWSQLLGLDPDLRPQMVLVGRLVTSINAGFARIRMVLDGPEDWFRLKLISMGYEGVNQATWPTEPNIHRIPLGHSGLELLIEARIAMSHSALPREELLLRQHLSLTLNCPKPVPIDELLGQFRKVSTFIEFARDQPVFIDHVYVATGEDDSWVEVLAAWQEGDRRTRFYHHLFWYADVEARFADHLHRWFELYDLIPLALDLYHSSARTSKSIVELRFFSLVSALESLHKSLYDSGDRALRLRLEDIVVRHGTLFRDLLRQQDCQLIVNTRNYLAHQTKHPTKATIPFDELWFWLRRLTMAFEICLLAELPFEPAHLQNIINRRWSAIESGSLGDWKF